MRNCLEKQYCIWPDKNQYLKSGVISSMINMHYNFLSNGFIFIDFSCYHIRLFINDEWIKHLTKSGLRLIIIADSTMEALASWWYATSPHVAAVIYASDDRHKIARKIENVFWGRQTPESRRPRLTANELKILEMLINEVPIKEISKHLNITEKRAYDLKRSMQLKMGGRLNRIIST